MSTILKLPNIQNIPYPDSTVPRDVKGAIDAITQIMDVDLVPQTPRTEETLVLLCGVLLYRHIDRFQRMEIVGMLRNPSIIAPIDGAELLDLILDVTIQPQWHLWSLTTEELVELLTQQKALVNIFTVLGVSVSLSAGKSLLSEVIKKGRLGKGGYVFIIALSASYVVQKQYNNTNHEMQNRTPEPLTSGYY